MRTKTLFFALTDSTALPFCICIAGGGANDAMHYYIIDMITNNIVRSGQNSKM